MATLHAATKPKPYHKSGVEIPLACDCHEGRIGYGRRTGCREVDGELWPVYRIHTGYHPEFDELLAVHGPDGLVVLG